MRMLHNDYINCTLRVKFESWAQIRYGEMPYHIYRICDT